MRVFLTWSGSRSRDLAVYLRTWLRHVLHQLDPWVSERDIEAGKVWPTEIVRNLRKASAGVICVTPENQSEPWVLFEAGALASSVGAKSKVCIYLLGMTPSELKPGPLTLYQATTAEKRDTLRLVESLNSSCGKHRLPDEILKNLFEQYWPDLQAVIDTLSTPETVATSILNTSDPVLAAVLAEVRRVAKQNEQLLGELRERTEQRAYLASSHEVQQELSTDAAARLTAQAAVTRPDLVPLINSATLLGDRDGGYELLAHDDETYQQLLRVQSDLDAVIRAAAIGWAVTIRRA